jgi:hypothetical protein
LCGLHLCRVFVAGEYFAALGGNAGVYHGIAGSGSRESPSISRRGLALMIMIQI